MTTRRYRPNGQTPPDPFAQAIHADAAYMADEMAGLLEAVKDYDQGSVKAILYQKPVAGQGPFKWIDEIYPPWDLPAVFQDLKTRFGGGDFELRVYAQGRVRKVVNIPIAKEREQSMNPATAAPAGPGFTDMFGMMMAQQAEARRDAQAASDRQMTLFMQMADSQAKMLGAILPAIAGGGGGGKVSETVALITALQDRGERGGGIKDTLEAMAAFKTLLGDQGGGEREGLGFDPDDLVSSGARLVGPAMKAIGDYVARMREQGSAAAPGEAGDPAAAEPPQALQLGPPASRFRLLNLVGVDVLYMFERGFDADRAADLIYELIEANHATDVEIDELALAFAISPTGLDDLAAEGIDLRARPQWAADFFASLAAIHQGGSDDLDGDEGGAGDTGGDGADRPKEPGRPAHP